MRFFVMYTSCGRVACAGPYATIEQANTVLDRIRLMGFTSAFVSAEQNQVGFA